MGGATRRTPAPDRARASAGSQAGSSRCGAGALPSLAIHPASARAPAVPDAFPYPSAHPGGRMSVPAGPTARRSPSGPRPPPSLARVTPPDRYGSDVLAGGTAHHPRRPTSVPTPAVPGLVVEEVTTGWVGAVVRVEKSGGLHV